MRESLHALCFNTVGNPAFKSLVATEAINQSDFYGFSSFYDHLYIRPPENLDDIYQVCQPSKTAVLDIGGGNGCCFGVPSSARFKVRNRRLFLGNA